MYLGIFLESSYSLEISSEKENKNMSKLVVCNEVKNIWGLCERLDKEYDYIKEEREGREKK